MELKNRTIKQTQKDLREKVFSAQELTQAYLKRIQETEENLGSFITVTEDLALQNAKEADLCMERGEINPLTGIPGAIKDNISTKNVLTTCASKILGNYVPPFDATVIRKLKEQNYVLLGKANLDEFAMGGSTENSFYHLTKNPYDLTRVPGGSSGGSAACVAAGQSLFALGSDTGGSVRQPAGYCGIVGLKPTYGRVSRYGVVAFGSSLDQVGVLAKNTQDVAEVLSAIAGQDPMDSTSAEDPVPCYATEMEKPLTGLRIGLVKELNSDKIQKPVREAVLKAVATFESLGAHCEEVSLPNLEHTISAYYIIAPSEASANLGRFDGIRYGYRAKDFEDLEDLYVKTRSEGFGDEVKRRILIGTFALSSGYYDAYYKKALQIRTLVAEDFQKAFCKFDLLLSPTTPGTAFKIGEKIADPISMYMEDLCTIPANLAGLPAMSVPCGKEGLMPIGMQLIGRHFQESVLLRAGNAFESATDFHHMRPEI